MEAKVRFVSPLERALYLKTVGSHNELSRGELAALAQHARERFFRKGAHIFQAGQRLESFHIVVEGSVRGTGEECGDEVLGPKRSVGFFTMLAQSSEGLEAVAETDTTTLEIAADDFFDVLEDQFNLVSVAARGMARIMLRAREQIAEGTYLAPAEGIIEPPDRELDLIERLLFLRRGTPLIQTDVDALVEIAGALEEHRFKKGEVLWKPGEPSGFVYMIVNGTVECTVKSTGRRWRAGPGYPLGNLESLAAEPRWYTAVTETEVVVLSGRNDAFLDVLENHFEMAQGFLASMARGLIGVRCQTRDAVAVTA